MKKFILPLLLFGFSTVATAQKDLLSTFSNVAKSATTNKKGDNSNSLTSGVQNILEDILGSSTLSAADLNGEWKYNSVACVFKSENLLEKAGGSLASSTVESKINESIKKLGFTGKEFSITFKADKTFIISIKGKEIGGKYTLNLKEKKITLSYLNKFDFTANIAKNGKNISILYDADKFFEFVTSITSTSSNASIASLSKMLKKYDGLMIGMKLQK
jgi:hypothetical protein